MTPPLLITVGFALIGVVGVFVGLRWRSRRRSGKAPDPVDVEMKCTLCQAELSLRRSDMAPLSSVEAALLVSEYPDTLHRKLAETRCSTCNANHTFVVDLTPPVWICANSFEPGGMSNHCAQCHKPLARPDWPVGAYDGQVDLAPGLKPLHGLKCPRCDAACCVECVKDATRGRTADGSFLCPRCYRGPVNQFYYF